MITQTEKDLIRLLKSFGLDKETTVGASILAKTDINREKMIQMLIALYREKGEVAEQDIQKIGIMLTGNRKADISMKNGNIEKCRGNLDD